MNFLPDVYVLCEVCGGNRYNHETLAVKYKGYSIADLLETPVADALAVLENIPQVRQKLQTLVDVGLATFISASRRSRSPAARRSASNWRANSASGRPGRRSICSTNRPLACTLTT